MKYYYLVEATKRNNLGDIIQGLAAKQFLPENAEAANREDLASLENEDGFLLANGWYQHYFDKFPAPEKIVPFYISVHIAARTEFLKIKHIREHFKANAPIGCRDIQTVWLLRGYGIPAYISGCLTLTFRNENIGLTSHNEVIWVDNVNHPIPINVELKLKELLPNGFVKISHDPVSRNLDFNTYLKDNTENVKHFFEMYKSAKLVLTTKIHCALPCIAFGIPVLLIHPRLNDPRLGALNKLITVISYDEFLEMRHLPKPTIRKHKLKRITHRLKYLTSLALSTGRNPFNDKSNRLLNLQNKGYVVIAYISQVSLKIIYKTGILRKKLESIFGKEYLTD
jgi:hypothetical protein